MCARGEKEGGRDRNREGGGREGAREGDREEDLSSSDSLHGFFARLIPSLLHLRAVSSKGGVLSAQLLQLTCNRAHLVRDDMSGYVCVRGRESVCMCVLERERECVCMYVCG